MTSSTLPRWSLPVNHQRLAQLAASQPTPELIHALVDQKVSLDVLESLLRAWPKRIPVILDFLDYFPKTHLGFYQCLRRLKPRLHQVWAATESIAQDLERKADIQAQIQPPLAVELPVDYKIIHLPFQPNFKAVVLGNFWNLGMVPFLKRVWARCQQAEPSLPPTEWHCHPEGLTYVHQGGFEPGPELSSAPFLQGEALWSTLRTSRLWP
ncbi:MAG: hypothetical protein HC904_13500 [Blastochloris sp.]|nr:hypothetical protein [Blastochloris sp.]